MNIYKKYRTTLLCMSMVTFFSITTPTYATQTPPQEAITVQERKSVEGKQQKSKTRKDAPQTPSRKSLLKYKKETFIAVATTLIVATIIYKKKICYKQPAPTNTTIESFNSTPITSLTKTQTATSVQEPKQTEDNHTDSQLPTAIQIESFNSTPITSLTKTQTATSVQEPKQTEDNHTDSQLPTAIQIESIVHNESSDNDNQELIKFKYSPKRKKTITIQCREITEAYHPYLDYPQGNFDVYDDNKIQTFIKQIKDENFQNNFLQNPEEYIITQYAIKNGYFFEKKELEENREPKRNLHFIIECTKKENHPQATAIVRAARNAINILSTFSSKIPLPKDVEDTKLIACELTYKNITGPKNFKKADLTGSLLKFTEDNHPYAQVSPSGKLIGLIINDNIEVFSLVSKKRLFSIDNIDFHAKKAIYFSPDDQYIVYHRNFELHTYRISDGAKIKSLSYSSREIGMSLHQLSFSNDGKKMAFCAGKSWHVYDIDTHTNALKIDHIADHYIQDITFDHEDKAILLVDRYTIQRYDLKTGKLEILYTNPQKEKPNFTATHIKHNKRKYAKIIDQFYYYHSLPYFTSRKILDTDEVFTIAPLVTKNPNAQFSPNGSYLFYSDLGSLQVWFIDSIEKEDIKKCKEISSGLQEVTGIILEYLAPKKNTLIAEFDMPESKNIVSACWLPNSEEIMVTNEHEIFILNVLSGDMKRLLIEGLLWPPVLQGVDFTGAKGLTEDNIRLIEENGGIV